MTNHRMHAVLLFSATILAGTCACWSQQADQPIATPPVVSAPPAPTVAVKKSKKGKAQYIGPNTVVELAPTPILDATGHQQLDPDAKPMFNPPVRQQRDKKGHPLFDADAKPTMQTADQLGYDEAGKKIHLIKQKVPKPVALAIVHGTLTVDGMTGKAGLNYEISDLKYIYLYAPWVGLTVVSNEAFPGAIKQSGAFDDKTLTVAVGEHTFQLYSDTRLLGKKPEPAFVLVDREYTLPSKSPVMGYGGLRKAPYAWPAAQADVEQKGGRQIPPLPINMRASKVH